MKLSQLIGDHSWALDIDSGWIAFNGRFKFPVQILGTESEISQTWLWAWANEKSGIPQELLKASNHLLRIGSELNIPELTNSQFPLEKVDGHYLSLVASGLLNASCYYRGPYEGGAVYLLISGSDVDDQMGFDALSFSNGIATLISSYEFNHRNAIFAYFKAIGNPIVEEEGEYLATLLNGEEIKIEFDHIDRMTNI